MLERFLALIERIAVALESLVAAIAVAAGAPKEVLTQAAGVPTAPPAVMTSAQLPAQAPPPKGTSKPKKTQTAAEPAPAPTATAPAQAPGAPLPAAPSVAADTLLKTATDAVIALANDFDGGREQALAILSKRRGVTRCSELKPDEVQGVLDDAVAAYATHKAKQNTAALI
jgi:hypothetical protein